MESNLSTFIGSTWGADSTDSRTRPPSQRESPENSTIDDRRIQVNSIRGSIIFLIYNVNMH